MPYILRFFGAIIIYLYEVAVSLLMRKKNPSFIQVWSKGNELQQKGVGFIFIMLLLFLLFQKSGRW
jgi:hypothetical protein